MHLLCAARQLPAHRPCQLLARGGELGRDERVDAVTLQPVEPGLELCEFVARGCGLQARDGRVDLIELEPKLVELAERRHLFPFRSRPARASADATGGARGGEGVCNTGATGTSAFRRGTAAPGRWRWRLRWRLRGRSVGSEAAAGEERRAGGGAALFRRVVATPTPLRQRTASSTGACSVGAHGGSAPRTGGGSPGDIPIAKWVTYRTRIPPPAIEHSTVPCTVVLCRTT